MKMRVLIAAGGTGGHIYPGIAVAREIRRRDPEAKILFVGAERGLEKKIVPDSGFELSLINSLALKSVGLLGQLKGLAVLPKSFLQARRILSDFRPDAVVGAGGYVTGPVLLMAALMRFPTLVMDSNALPGFTNRQLARFVDKAALTFEEARPYFGRKGVVTGNPVRREFFDIAPKEPDPDNFALLLFGGSQGARGINLAMIDALEHLREYKNRLQITHQTGRFDFDKVSEGYARHGWKTANITEYITDMVGQFADTDLIISRAGATTCAEISAAGKPAIMIPLPTAADDHQRVNAEALQTAGAAKMILQRDLTGEVLAKEIENLINSPEKITAMGRAAKTLAKTDAAAATVDLIEELAKKP